MTDILTMKKLLAIDGSSFLYRAYHGYPKMKNNKGFITGAIYGSLNMIYKLIAKIKPDYVCVVYDPSGKTFRHDLYPLYKANRPKQPDELRLQTPYIHEIMDCNGWNVIIKDGYEADDVIGSVVKLSATSGVKSIIATGDKDMAQLVNNDTILYNSMSNEILDRNGVIRKFGVEPEQITAYLSLVGDVADNIPGLYKCGAKTAIKLITEHKTIDNVEKYLLTRKEDLNIDTYLKFIEMSKELVTIKTDIELNLEITDLCIKPANINRLRLLYNELEFVRWSGYLNQLQMYI